MLYFYYTDFGKKYNGYLKYFTNEARKRGKE